MKKKSLATLLILASMSLTSYGQLKFSKELSSLKQFDLDGVKFKIENNFLSEYFFKETIIPKKKTNDFYMLKESKCSSTLSEGPYASNYQDFEKLTDSTFIEITANQHVEGLRTFIQKYKNNKNIIVFAGHGANETGTVNSLYENKITKQKQIFLDRDTSSIENFKDYRLIKTFTENIYNQKLASRIVEIAKQDSSFAQNNIIYYCYDIKNENKDVLQKRIRSIKKESDKILTQEEITQKNRLHAQIEFLNKYNPKTTIALAIHANNIMGSNSEKHLEKAEEFYGAEIYINPVSSKKTKDLQEYLVNSINYIRICYPKQMFSMYEFNKNN